MQKRRRIGQTLIDLCAAIAVLGLMLQLLLPAIQSVRESSRRNRCAANLREIGLAMTAHQAAKGHWPSGGWHFRWIGEPERGTGPRQPGSWAFNLLDYLGENELRSAGRNLLGQERFDAIRKRCATPVEVFHCPSRREPAAFPYRENRQPFTRGGIFPLPLAMAAKTDYAANVGDGLEVEFDWTWMGPRTLAEGDNSRFPWPDHRRFTGIIYGRSQVRPRKIVDGLAKTYLVGEKFVDPLEYETGADWGDNESVFAGFNNDNCRSTNQPAMPDEEGQDHKTRFGSAHPSVWQVVYCDGSVHAHDYDLDPKIHRDLGNRMDSRPRLRPSKAENLISSEEAP